MTGVAQVDVVVHVRTRAVQFNVVVDVIVKLRRCAVYQGY